MKIISKKSLNRLITEAEFQEARAQRFQADAVRSRQQLKKAQTRLEAARIERDHLRTETEDLKRKLGRVPNMVSLKERYEQRLEELKKGFNKQPEPHRLDIEFEDGIKKVEGDLDELEELAAQINDSVDEDFIEINDRVYRREKIIAYQFREGHPTNYTDAEITDWAEERLEKEMEGWRVAETLQLEWKALSPDFVKKVAESVKGWDLAQHFCRMEGRYVK